MAGGKILAKFDCPAHDFLFPDNDAGQGTKRTIVLDHARHYKVQQGGAVLEGECVPALEYYTLLM